MSIYEFDEVINREGTDAVKVEMMQDIWGTKDLIPMWVADMEFKTPDFVLDAVKEIVNQKILGYTVTPIEWYNAIINWQKKTHDWAITKEAILYLPSVVYGLSVAVATFSKKRDGIMINKPVYPPFFEVIENLDRTVINLPLTPVHHGFEIDFDLMEKKIKDCKMFILCHPHNPSGRVWKEDELKKIASICKKNDVLVLSDEIHSDLNFIEHQSFATVSAEAKNNSIVFNSPSKAFNMAGFNSAYAIIQNPEIKSKMREYLTKTKSSDGHVFAYKPVIAAYTQGDDWLKALKNYIEENIDFTIDFINQNTPKIKATKPDATYLLWLNCKALNLNQKELNKFFVREAGLALNSGHIYGEEGEGFMRMNIACPKSTLQKALNQLHEAYNKNF